MKSEQLEGLLKKIRTIQSIMVDVSTGGSLIQEREDEYIVLYIDITTEIESLANFLREKDGISRIELLPYHALSADKYRRLGREGGEWEEPSEKTLSRIQRQLEEYGFEVGLRG